MVQEYDCVAVELTIEGLLIRHSHHPLFHANYVARTTRVKTCRGILSQMMGGGAGFFELQQGWALGSGVKGRFISHPSKSIVTDV